MGKAMGASAARLAELGRQRLQALGLVNLGLPTLRAGMCKTCACQPDTVPNGCLQTQLDFLKCAVEGIPFRCHSPHDGRLCTGWVRARAVVAATPMPPELLALIAKHQLSPPDEPSAT